MHRQSHSEGAQLKGSTKSKAKPQTFKSVPDILAIVVAVTAVALLVWRIQYGIDLHDEASYVAIALRFAQGARPLIDYLDSHQFAPYLLSPFVRLHLALFGREGLVLSMRILYLVAQLATGWLAYVFLGLYFDRRIALVSVAVSICAIPFLIPSLSYNSLGALLVCSAVSCTGIGMAEDGRRGWIVAAGACLGVAGVVYPAAILLGSVAALILLAIQRTWRTPALVAAGWLAGLAAAGVWFLPFMSGLGDFFQYNRGLLTTGLWGNGLDKAAQLATLGGQVMIAAPAFWVAVIISIIFVSGRKVPRVLWIAFPLLLPVAPFDYRWIGVVAAVTLISTIVLVASGASKKGRRPALLWGILTALAFSLMLGYASGTSFNALGVGAGSVLALCLALALDKAAAALAGWMAPSRAAVAAVLLGFVLLVATGTLLARVAYLDGVPMAMDARVPRGPYLGLLTTPERAAIIAQLQSDIERTVKPGEQVFSYFVFPAVHLFLDRPGPSRQIWFMPIEWTVPSSINLVVTPVFADPKTRPDVVIVNRGVPAMFDISFSVGEPTFWRFNDEMATILAADGYKTVATGPQWTILRSHP
jgi:hypothetical protein